MRERLSFELVSADGFRASCLVVATPWDEECRQAIETHARDLAKRTPKEQLRARKVQNSLEMQFHCDAFMVSLVWEV